MSFKENYTQKVLPEIAKELDIKNPMQLPMIEKVVVNMGIGSYVASGHKDFSSLKNDLALITGQLPRVNHARKSVSNFKLREGMPVGMMVTLRGQRMYDFLEKLIAVVLPRVRDFRGVSATAFDGRGNYTLGVKEQLIFPEIEFDKVNKVRGLDVVIVTTAKTNAEATALLKGMGMPFAK